MKEFITRAISGLLYAIVLIVSMYWQTTLAILMFGFGVICMMEFSRLIHLKSYVQYAIFVVLYWGFWLWCIKCTSCEGYYEAIQILLVLTIFVNLFLIRDLFVEKKTPLFTSRGFLVITFYLASGFVFIVCIANSQGVFRPLLLLGSFILIWVNDTFAYLIGKNFGHQKLFPSISPKKTIEGFLGGLFFACISSYFIAMYTETLTFSSWLVLAIIISVFGTLGDLIESKFKRQAQVKDSGRIMPGHGGLLDRLDSIIFVAPFIYLFLIILNYVS